MPKVSRGSRHAGARRALSGYATMAYALGEGLSAAQARREVTGALHEMGPVIYGVLTKDGLIKFGHSIDLRNRLQAYGIGVKNSKRLLMVKPGTLVDEQVIHGRFAHHVAHGREYFHPAREIIDYINTVRADMGVPDLLL